MRLLAKYSLIVLTVVAAFGVVSCSDVSDPTKRFGASVLCQFTTSQARQSVFLYRTMDIHDEGSSFFYPFPEFQSSRYASYFIENATVFVTDAHGRRHDFHLRIDSSYGAVSKSYVNVDSFAVQPEASYSLSVRTGDVIVEGQTTLPGDFRIVSPDPGRTYATTDGELQLDLSWTRSKNAFGYVASVIIARRVLIGSPYRERHSYIAFDTVYSPASRFRVSSADTCFVEVLSFDVNYYNHKFRGVPNSGVTGAYGYVGSSVLQSMRVRVQ